jgi:hypothetical protein
MEHEERTRDSDTSLVYEIPSRQYLYKLAGDAIREGRPSESYLVAAELRSVVFELRFTREALERVFRRLENIQATSKRKPAAENPVPEFDAPARRREFAETVAGRTGEVPPPLGHGVRDE